MWPLFMWLPILAPQVVIDVGRPGGVVPAALFGTNLPARAEASPEVSRQLRELGLTLHRYPGGGSPGWRWMEGRFDFGVGGNDNTCTLITLEAASGFVAQAGGELLFMVNIESGDAAEAAGLAAASLDLGVRYFEIGNEVFGDWDRGYRGAAQYASDLIDFARAIKAVAPNAQVGADMAGAYRDVDDDGDAIDTADWDRVVLRGAGSVIDFLSYHWYPGRQIQEEARHVMAGSLRIPEDVARFRRLVSELAPGRDLPLGYLEWDGVFDRDTLGMRHTLANAIFYADALGQMMREGVALAAHYEATTRSYGLLVGYDPCAQPEFPPWDGRTVRPKGFAIQLSARLAGGELLPTTVTGAETYSVTTQYPLQEYAGDVPEIAAYAVKTADGLKILFVHREANDAVDIVVRLDGLPMPMPIAGNAVFRTLSGPALNADNETNPVAVDVTTTMAKVGLPAFQIALPPRAVQLVEIFFQDGDEGGGGAGMGGQSGSGGRAGSGTGTRRPADNQGCVLTRQPTRPLVFVLVLVFLLVRRSATLP